MSIGTNVLAPPHRNDFRAESLQQFQQQIAANGRVLIDHQPLALQSVGRKEIGVSPEIRISRLREFRTEFRRTGFHRTVTVEFGNVCILPADPRPDLLHLDRDRGLIFLQQLAFCGIGFISVAIERNVAARHHHAAALATH